MALYEVTGDRLEPQPIAEFAALEMYERADLQRLLREDVSVLGEDLLVVAEEFSQWEDARRRIDLLALDRTGHLVVIEIKRTGSGGHMDLQAIRYAAMISSMTLDDVARAYAAFVAQRGAEEDVDARTRILEFMDARDDDEEPSISSDVRVILVSADFGREVTTTVLWLNGFEGMDIRCVRLVPYQVQGRILLDIQQVIPLPDAADYQVRLRRKEAEQKRATSGDGRDFTRYHVIVNGQELPDENKRQAIRLMIQKLIEKGVPLAAIHDVLPSGKMAVLEGRFHSSDEVNAELERVISAPSRARRHFAKTPFVDEGAGKTYVLFRGWGLDTEPTLTALVNAFPQAGVTFRAADD